MTFTRTLMDQNPSRFAYALTENRNKLSFPHAHGPHAMSAKRTNTWCLRNSPPSGTPELPVPLCGTSSPGAASANLITAFGHPQSPKARTRCNLPPRGAIRTMVHL